MIREPYNILTKSTLDAYKNIIYNIFDKSPDLDGYKNVRGKPGETTPKGIASEIYSYFLTHYCKAIDLYNYQDEISINWLNDGELNIIDIGANIGTVTFAYIDILQNINKAKNISFNIIFVEPDAYRCNLLKKAINKYIEVSNLNIQYYIINKNYEDSLDDIENEIQQSNTIILMSNLLNWISDSIWERFKETLAKNIRDINLGYGCKVINIEATSPTNSQFKIEKLYREISVDESIKFYDNKKIPEFNNIEECYFYNPTRKIYRTNKRYYYGFIVKYKHFDNNIDAGYIDIAYNKALYTCRNSSLYDNLEMKYVNLNYKKIRKHISELISTGVKSSSYKYQYRIKKSIEKTRPLYIDDFINDIVNTTIIITEGLEADKSQNADISYGNRVDKDMNSPYVFNPYYVQFFKKLKDKERSYLKLYKYYYKIDLSQYYNSISHEKLKDILKNYEGLNKEWCKCQIDSFINQKLIDCKKGYGLAQGPDLSHLLANLYLKNFDEWFESTFDSVKLIRYVDDMEIVGNTQEECKKALEKSNKYLSDVLSLNINQQKNQNGELVELFVEEKDNFYEKIISLTTYILKSLYKLDDKNYKKYKNNKKNFISVYQKCLNRLGIYLSKEWLDIKIDNEINYLIRMKNKFNNQKKLARWLKKKKIYDTNLKLGKIPESYEEKRIDIWYIEFINQNEPFIKELDSLKRLLAKKFNEVIESVKSNKDTAIENKSLFKFIINKIHIFKCVDFRREIDVVEQYFPYYNKKVLSTYSECYEYVKDKLNNEYHKKYELYDYAISIWLLGEYRREDSLKILQEIFKESLSEKQYFINTLATEAILKIGKSDDNFIDILKEQVLQDKDYYAIRNSLLILNVVDNISDIIESVENNGYKEKRISIFIEWLKNNIKSNIVDEVECIPKEYKENYPTYPIDINYISR